ncbi:hypothetical protein O9992_21755 [Vibrio lentus]|nr:hypothetical protein [Vibrio lentus]
MGKAVAVISHHVIAALVFSFTMYAHAASAFVVGERENSKVDTKKRIDFQIDLKPLHVSAESYYSELQKSVIY